MAAPKACTEEMKEVTLLQIRILIKRKEIKKERNFRFAPALYIWPESNRHGFYPTRF